MIFVFKKGSYKYPIKKLQKMSKTNDSAKQYLYRKEWYDNFPYEKIMIPSYDSVILYANYFKNNSHKYCIILHGYRSTREANSDIGEIFYNEGYNVLFPSSRKCDESQAKNLSMGDKESKDLLYWIKDIIRKDNEAEIVIFGRSMGAHVAMLATGFDLPKNVKCVIEDSGYVSAYRQLKDLCRKVPYFKWFVSIIRITGIVFMNFDIKKSAVKALQKAQIPVLFIHGAKDDFVNIKNLTKCYEACASKKQQEIFDAGHTLAFISDKDRYTNVITKFIRENVD